MTIACNGEDDFTLITAATAQWHDYEWLARDLPEGLSLADLSGDLSTLIVTGPQARDLLHQVGAEADLHLPWLSHQSAMVAGRPCTLARVSFAGELGWEVHARERGDPGALHGDPRRGGAKPFGMFALNSLRIEKGYRAWKGDLFHRLQPARRRARPVHPFRQAAGFPRQGGASGREAAGRDEAFS